MRRDEKILVVEDNPTICREMEQRFNCDCATDGWAAIEKLETRDYAAILMSKSNGEKARAAVAKRNRTKQREKDRARLAELRSGAAAQPAPATKKSSKASA